MTRVPPRSDKFKSSSHLQSTGKSLYAMHAANSDLSSSVLLPEEDASSSAATTPSLFQRVSVADSSHNQQAPTTAALEGAQGAAPSKKRKSRIPTGRPRGRPPKYPPGSQRPSKSAKKSSGGTSTSATPAGKPSIGNKKDVKKDDSLVAGLQGFTLDSPIPPVPVLATTSAPCGDLEGSRPAGSLLASSMRTAIEAAEALVKRKRGRPKSIKSLDDHAAAMTASETVTPVPLKTPKNPPTKQPTLAVERNETPAPKRKRGRPKKSDSERSRNPGRPSKKRDGKRPGHAPRSTETGRPLTIDDLITETEEDDNEWQDIDTDDDGAVSGSKAERKEEKRRFVAKQRLNPTLNAAWSPVLNPLPGYIDAITCSEVVRPAISPFGHVLRCLCIGDSKNTCPFTKQPLTKRQLVLLDYDNIEQYRSLIQTV